MFLLPSSVVMAPYRSGRLSRNIPHLQQTGTRREGSRQESVWSEAVYTQLHCLRRRQQDCMELSPACLRLAPLPSRSPRPVHAAGIQVKRRRDDSLLLLRLRVNALVGLLPPRPRLHARQQQEFEAGAEWELTPAQHPPSGI